MKTWKIPVVWQMMGYIEVEAGTLAEAIKIAKDDNNSVLLPHNGEYLDESWEVDMEDDEEFLRESYNGGQEDE